VYEYYRIEKQERFCILSMISLRLAVVPVSYSLSSFRQFVPNFLSYVSAKYYLNWFTVGKVIIKITRRTFYCDSAVSWGQFRNPAFRGSPHCVKDRHSSSTAKIGACERSENRNGASRKSGRAMRNSERAWQKTIKRSAERREASELERNGEKTESAAHSPLQPSISLTS